MNIKNIIFNLIVTLIAFLCFVLWYEQSESDSSKATVNMDRRYTVYLITTDKEYEYWQYINKGAADMANLTDTKYRWEAPNQRNTQEQIQVLRKAVDDGADAILIAVNDPRKLSGPIEDAKARGVKFVYVDSPAMEEAVTTLATDNYSAGTLAGTSMLKELNMKGIKEGDIGIFGVTPEYDITMARERGFRDVIEKDGKFRLLNTIYKNGDQVDTEVAAEELIGQNKNLVGLLGTNEGSTEGVGKAIQATKANLVGIGFDQTQENIKLYRSGAITALVLQNPYTMGYLGMAEALASLRGYDTGPQYINTGTKLLEKN